MPDASSRDSMVQGNKSCSKRFESMDIALLPSSEGSIRDAQRLTSQKSSQRRSLEQDQERDLKSKVDLR